MKSLKFVLIAVAAFLLAYYAYSPYMTIDRMSEAAEQNDAEALAGYIDFPSVRQSLKRQLDAKVEEVVDKRSEESPVKALGVAVGGLLVEKLVDAYVTPEGMRLAMQGKQPASGNDQQAGETAEGNDKPFGDASFSYNSLNMFTATVKDDETGKEIDFVFSRSGFVEWTLTEISLPL
ncbi:MAG: DUF2939 domain-containing protein [Gammaproteobacteria bacterium]|jgi:hypothetical protein